MPAAQPNKPSTNDTKQKSRHAGEIADLFRVLRNMSRDERISDVEFRIAFRIAQAVNAETEIAEIGDALLMDELPRTQDKRKLRLFRRRMTELGWLKISSGVRGRATQYQFLNDNSAAIEERAERAKVQREVEFNLRQINRKTGLQATALGGSVDPLTGEVLNEIRGQPGPLNGSGRSEIRGESLLNKGSVDPPLLPQRSTSEDPLPMEEMTQGDLPTAPSGLWGLCWPMMDECESCDDRDGDYVVKFRADGKWRLRTICLECIPGDYAIQCGEADAFKLPGQ